MKSPWTKKNPFLSMWMSGANAAMGHARNQATAASRRQTGAAVAAGTKQILEYWGGKRVMAAPKRKRKTG